jgi:hypothetical protein
MHKNSCLYKDGNDVPYTNFVKKDENKNIKQKASYVPGIQQ